MEFSDFAKAVKDFRTFRGKTVYEVAKASGVSHTYISQIENGKRVPSLKVLFPLVRFLGAENDKGYLGKMENIEYNESGLLDIYAECKDVEAKNIHEKYLEYITEDIRKELSILHDPEMIDNNQIKINKNDNRITSIEKPYYDLKWLLNQSENYIFYGREYDIRGLKKESEIITSTDIYSILTEEDLATISDLIEAYISNKYPKINEGD